MSNPTTTTTKAQPDTNEAGSRSLAHDFTISNGNLNLTENITTASINVATPPNAFVSATSSYKLIWRGSPNFWSGRSGQKPLAICDHIMQGTLESSDSWFRNRSSQVSAHFGVGKDGRIWQWVHTQDSAWANGILQSPDTTIDWLAECVRNNINPNHCTLSIEHEGYTGVPFPPEQYKATLWLHRHLCVNYNIIPDRKHIIGHYQITAYDRANCPGKAFPWGQLMKDLAASGIQPPGSQWTNGVKGVVFSQFGPGKVIVNNSYVRSRPSLSSKDNTLIRTVPAGTLLHFVAYTDAGPVYHGSGAWYLIADSDGGGWIHSVMLAEM